MSLSRAWRLLRTSKRDNTKALACPTDLFDLRGEKISPSLFLNAWMHRCAYRLIWF